MAADLLRDLADKTASAPEPAGTGKYHYIHTRGAHLRTNRLLQRSGGSTVTGSVEPFEREEWIAADGSGRILVTKEGRPVLPSGDYGPGQLRVPTAEPRTTKEALRAFVQVWRSQVVTPVRQRRLLLDLAECAGLTAAPGSGVSYLDRARHVQHLLTFDPHTGNLISAEERALAGARLPIEVPAVISHTTWLESKYCETLG